MMLMTMACNVELKYRSWSMFGFRILHKVDLKGTKLAIDTLYQRIFNESATLCRIKRTVNAQNVAWVLPAKECYVFTPRAVFSCLLLMLLPFQYPFDK